MKKHRIHFLPKTRLGKWSGLLILAFFALLIIAQIIITIGQAQGAFEQEGFNYFLVLIPICMIPAFISGVAAFVTALISIIKYKERAVAIFITALIGLLITIFLLGEFIYPH